MSSASSSSGAGFATVANVFGNANTTDSQRVWRQAQQQDSKLYFWTLDTSYQGMQDSIGELFVLFAPQQQLPAPQGTPCLIGLSEFNNLRRVDYTEAQIGFKNPIESSIGVKTLDGQDDARNMNVILKGYKSNMSFQDNALKFQQIFNESMAIAVNPSNFLNPKAWNQGKLNYRAVNGGQVQIGVCYILLKGNSLLAPNNATYVKLRADDFLTGELFILNSKTAAANNLYQDGMYIPLDTIKLLMTGNFDSGSTKGYIRIRNAEGDIVDIQGTFDPRKWSRAYEVGTAKQESSWVRSRNPQDLSLLFVIMSRDGTSGPAISVKKLTQLINIAMDNAKIPIRQQVQVVFDGTPAAYTAKQTYNFKLGESPFGVYETWIKMADYASFLTAYPDRPFPEDEAAIQKIFAKINVNPGIAGSDSRVRSVRISSKTVIEAGKPGARDEIPDQKATTGISATQIALAFAWANAGDRLQGKTVGGMTWDSPGTFPSEWAHRIGLSYGNKAGYAANQVTENLIFATSDVNSLMTRYERAWQALAVREYNVRRYRFQHLQPFGEELKEFSWELQTANTVDNIYQRTVSGNTVTETQLGLDKAQTYYGWVDKYPNLSFTLRYFLQVTRCYVLDVEYKPMVNIFYPFQSGFFTRIEADVDQLILQEWEEQANRLVDVEVQLRQQQSTQQLAAVTPVLKRTEAAVDNLTKNMAKISIATPPAAPTSTPTAKPIASN